MSALEVDQDGENGFVRHPNRQTLLNFIDHLRANDILKFSYPMPDQERGDGWMIFLYVRVSQEIIDSFEG
ncbi:MAG: hypothetical protein QGF94_05225 [Candidatus Thalassarchaeaceae archaeon]|jgi:hypothetical protein|nr:hypothetical protein [Candidatus Thalassarchaeaceae archaeon]